MYDNLDFDSWMQIVDREVEAKIGLSVHDLEDCPFRDWFDDGTSAESAAQMAINNSDNGDYDEEAEF